MARFDSDGDMEIIITPKEFIQNCSSVELLQLQELAKDEFDLVESPYVIDEKGSYDQPHRSYSQTKFNEALVTLEENWYSLTKIDGDIIEDISKKYK